MFKIFIYLSYSTKMLRIDKNLGKTHRKYFENDSKT